MDKFDRVELERLRYWQGQMLKSRDFRDQAAIEAQLRWWHNRALHNAYGVRYGLTVSRVIAEEKFVAVSVSCGLAYDCFGRELILQTPHELALPATGPQTLLIRYRETAQFPAKRDVSGACSPGRCAALWEQPDMFWKPSAHIKVTDGVPLAQLSYEPAPVLEVCARLARPLARPRIGSGATVPEGTAWELWSERVSVDREISEVPVGIQVTVDTSAAGFTETPCYFAWLEGTLWSQSNIEFFPVPLAHIDLASIKRFHFRLWMPMLIMLLGARARVANLNFDTEFINFARKQKLYVCWIGIQPTVTDANEIECAAEAKPEYHTLSEG